MEPRWDENSPEWQALDAEIPEDDLVRVIRESVTSGIFDVEAVFDIYSGRGKPPHRPDLLLMLALYEHCRGRTKPTEWHEDLESNIKVRWLTFGLTVGLRTLYRFRDRVGVLIQGWHNQVLQAAVAEELVDGSQASIDGTTVAANASRRKVANLDTVEQRLRALDEATSSSTEEPTEQSGTPAWMAKTDAGKQEQTDRYHKAQKKLLGMQAENRKRRSDKRKPEHKIVISLTDPESVFGLDKEKVFRPLYNVQALSDLSTDFVLAYEVFAQHSDAKTLQVMINRVFENGIFIRDLLADAGYPVGEDLEYCETLNITLYAPWQENSTTASKKASAKPRVEKEAFQWDAQRVAYICPEGKDLPFSHKKTRQRANGDSVEFDVHQASPLDCMACPLQSICTTAPQKGRTVRRDPYQELIDRLKARMETDEAKLLYKRRSQNVERVFADFKEHRALRRFRGRGLQRAQTQLGLTVLGHNLRILAKLRKQKSSEYDVANTHQNAA